MIFISFRNRTTLSLLIQLCSRITVIYVLSTNIGYTYTLCQLYTHLL